MALLSKRTLRGLVSEVLCTREEEEDCDVATRGLQRLPEQQRLVFSPSAPIAVTCCDKNPLGESLQTVQAIIFQDSRALGRLVNPRVFVDSPGELTPASLVSLVYDYWQPTSADRKLGPEQHLQIPLDAHYRSTSSFAISAILVGRPGGALALPGRHEWSGSKTAAAVNQHQQRIKYIQEAQQRYAQGEGKDSPNRHPLARSEAEYTIETGPEWEASSVSLTFNTASELPWLQRVILKLLVIPKAAVDDSGSPAGQTTAEVSVTSSDSDAPGSVAMASASTTQPVPQHQGGHQQTTSGRVKQAADDQQSSSLLRQGQASTSGVIDGQDANAGGSFEGSPSVMGVSEVAPSPLSVTQASAGGGTASAGVGDGPHGSGDSGAGASSHGKHSGSSASVRTSVGNGYADSTEPHEEEVRHSDGGLLATRSAQSQSERRQSEAAESPVPSGSLSDRGGGAQPHHDANRGGSKVGAVGVCLTMAPEQQHTCGSPVADSKPTVKLIPGASLPSEAAHSGASSSPRLGGVSASGDDASAAPGSDEMVADNCKSGCCGRDAAATAPEAVDRKAAGSSKASSPDAGLPQSREALRAAELTSGSAGSVTLPPAQQPLQPSVALPPPPPPPPPQRQYPNGPVWPQLHGKGAAHGQDQHHPLHQAAAASASAHLSHMPHLQHHLAGHGHALSNGKMRNGEVLDTTHMAQQLVSPYFGAFAPAGQGSMGTSPPVHAQSAGQPHAYPNGLETAALLQQLLLAQQNGTLQLQLHQQHQQQQLQGLLSNPHVYGWQHQHLSHQQLPTPQQAHMQAAQQQQQQLMHHAAVQQHAFQQHMLQQAVQQQHHHQQQQQQQLLLQGLAQVHLGQSELHGNSTPASGVAAPAESSASSSFPPHVAPPATAVPATLPQSLAQAAADSSSGLPAAAAQQQPSSQVSAAPSSFASTQPAMPAPIVAPTPVVAPSAGDSAGPSSWETGSASSVRSEPSSAMAPPIVERPLGPQHRVQSHGNVLAAASHGGGGGGGGGGHAGAREGGGGRSSSSYKSRTSYNGAGGGVGGNTAGGGGGAGQASGMLHGGGGQYGNRTYGNAGGSQRHGTGPHGYSRGGRYDGGHGGSAESSRPSSRGPPPHGGGGYSRQPHPADPVPPPDSQSLPDPKGSCDLDRFISQIEPFIAIDPAKPPQQALQELRLRDLWNFYFEPSLYGREVFTLGGHRGASNSYFVPYLSAIQIFTRALPTDVGGTNRLYVSEDNQGWPKHMHLKFEHFEHELPFNRLPLYDQIEHLSAAMAAAAAAAAGGGKAAHGGSSGGGAAAPAVGNTAGTAGPSSGSKPSAPSSAAAAATAVPTSTATAGASEASSPTVSEGAPRAAAAANGPLSMGGSTRSSETGDIGSGRSDAGKEPSAESSPTAGSGAAAPSTRLGGLEEAADSPAAQVSAPTEAPAAGAEAEAASAPASTESPTAAATAAATPTTPASLEAGAAADPAAAASSSGGSSATSGGGSSTSSSDGDASVGSSSSSGTSSSGGGATGSGLLYDMRLLDVHPASWFAVAWYPVYRIPDAPLYARFLTFHSFAPLVESMRNVHERLAMGQVAPCCLLSLPVVGLNWYNMQGERWMEPLDESAVAAAHLQAHGGQPPPPASAPGGISGSSPRAPPHSRGGGGSSGRVPGTDVWYQHLLHNLQSTADRLARGVGLRVLGQHGAEEVRLRVPDYEFFRARSS